ncbi:Acyl-protein thioesterase-like protein [Hapsidospora chrysogenum ATCC 11550]|uniref:Acyl-protein thioesterase-like protein n=1 Tax=Hapsidospora chrysogenum (strain ATCC 11550 / CBS 779.69 / DSM 880 / IAM 14645 / JCM 23072 / IMI 49137) TaxID=857340 RepID=A0A086TGS5_HAPC1|nr:Acyl-protein thioesterase-like protein [Hapsidospora chrysogenum ATCC 11550]
MDTPPPPPIIVGPKEPHTHTVIFLHGRGGSADNLVASLTYWSDSQGRTLAEIFPSFRWVYPRAPIGHSAAFPGDKIAQWFDNWNVRDFTDREEVQAPGLRQSVARMLGILEEEAKALDGRWERLVLMGISQGGATIVHTLLHLHRLAPRLGALVGYSCRMPFAGRSLPETRRILRPDDSSGDNNTEALKGTPILLEHCVDDPLVLVGMGRTLRDTLRGFGAHVTWVEYPDGGHWLNSPRGVEDAAQFLSRALGCEPAPVGNPDVIHK